MFVFVQMTERIKGTVQRISEAFERKDYETAKRATMELKYYYSLRDHILNMDSLRVDDSVNRN